MSDNPITRPTRTDSDGWTGHDYIEDEDGNTMISPLEEQSLFQKFRLADNISQLVTKYKTGDNDKGPYGVDAWDKIADLVIENSDVIIAALRSPAIPAPAQEVVVTKEMITVALNTYYDSEQVYQNWYRQKMRAALEAALHPSEKE